MNLKNVIGVILILIGGACIVSGQRIALRVAAGETRVNKAQSQMDSSHTLFGINPLTEQLSQPLTQSAQAKIDRANQQIAKYGAIAKKMRVTGVLLLGIGTGVLLWSYRQFRLKRHTHGSKR